MPCFTYGKSRKVAWGATALNPDISDLFREKIEGNKYFYEGEWHDLKIINETIKVRFGSDIHIQFKQTANGVVMNPLNKEQEDVALWFPY